MSLWSIIVPEGTTNLVTNPSVERDTTGWAAIDGAIARSALHSAFGLYSLAVTPTSNPNDGVRGPGFAAMSGGTYTFSVYVRGVAGVPYRIFMRNAGATHTSAPTAFVGDGAWHRHTNSYTAEATETLYVYVTKASSASTETFYVDAAQVEAKPYATTYCDGSLDAPIGFISSGCTWTGVAHASTSSRSATARAGGRERDLEEAFGFRALNDLGTGAPPLSVITSPYIALDGAMYDDTQVLPRSFTIIGAIVGSSLADLQTKRGDLIDALFPNSAREPVLLRYGGPNRKLEIAAHYEGGLEGGESINFVERVAIRFLAPHPYWREVVE